MARQSKRIKHLTEILEKTPSADLPTAVEILKKVEGELPAKIKKCRFDQTVAIAVRLGVDPKQADQTIRSSLSLPHGIGKAKRVVAFCPEHLVETAKAASSDVHLLVAGSAVSHRLDGNTVSLEIPSIDLNEVIAIDFSG